MELIDKEVINTYKIMENKENKIMRKYNLFKKVMLTMVAGIASAVLMTGCGSDGSTGGAGQGANNEEQIILEDVYSFAINGKVYTCPMLFGDFIGDASDIYYEKAPNDLHSDPWHNLYVYNRENNTEIAKAFLYYDDYKTAHTIEDEYMYWIELNQENYKDGKNTFKLYGDITFGSSTEDVKKIYGEPSQILDNGNDEHFIYKELDPGNTYMNNDFTFSFEDGKLVEVDIKHTTDKSSFNEE